MVGSYSFAISMSRSNKWYRLTYSPRNAEFCVFTFSAESADCGTAIDVTAADKVLHDGDVCDVAPYVSPAASGNEDDVSPDDIGDDVAADVRMGGGRERDGDASLLEPYGICTLCDVIGWLPDPKLTFNKVS